MSRGSSRHPRRGVVPAHEPRSAQLGASLRGYDRRGAGRGAETMSTHVIAIFADRHAVHAAIEQLVQAGFTRDAISLLMSENTHESQFGGESTEGSGVSTIRAAGVLGAMASAMVKFPAPVADFVLCGTGPWPRPRVVSRMEKASTSWRPRLRLPVLRKTKQALSAEASATARWP
jgi:hypothetical protein